MSLHAFTCPTYEREAGERGWNLVSNCTYRSRIAKAFVAHTVHSDGPIYISTVMDASCMYVCTIPTHTAWQLAPIQFDPSLVERKIDPFLII